MMSINGFAYRIDALSKPPGMTVKAVRRAMRMASVPLVTAAIALGASPAIAQNRDQVRVVFEHALPNVEGKRIVAVMVSYPPGGKSLAHRHAASAFIYAYVLSGAIRSQVGNDPAKVYHAGEGFYEMPGSHHRISENASDKESASLRQPRRWLLRIRPKKGSATKMAALNVRATVTKNRAAQREACPGDREACPG
jgi:quercetin dioxygenase-like cupin family protein